jgi:hypothetical protein
MLRPVSGIDDWTKLSQLGKRLGQGYASLHVFIDFTTFMDTLLQAGQLYLLCHTNP